MADLARAEELVQTMGRDDTFRAAVEGAPTVTAKRQVLDAQGFQDVGLEEMRAYVESKGGTLVVPGGNRELSDSELASVAGGVSDAEAVAIGLGGGAIVAIGVAAASAV